MPTGVYEHKRRPLKERFDEKYIPEPNSGCWLWTGALNQDGYGHMRIGKPQHGAHRISWMVHRGSIPGDLNVLHTCDVPSCVNPDHLYLGTQVENGRDMMNRKRHFIFKNREAVIKCLTDARPASIAAMSGEKHHSSKLTRQQAQEIRLSSKSHTQLTRDYGVGKSAIWKIKTNRSWKDI